MSTLKDHINASTKRKKRLLIVDDDESILDIFHLILSHAGYEVEVIQDATQFAPSKIKTPDLFLIDKHLSGVNGLDLCRQLKLNIQTESVPVIMISGSPDIAELAGPAGADAFIEKPFEMSYLLDVVRFYLGEIDVLKKVKKSY